MTTNTTAINNALRLVLIAANALLIVWTAYLFSTNAGTYRAADFWFGWGLLICLGLNFIYLLLNPQKSNSRILPADRPLV